MTWILGNLWIVAIALCLGTAIFYIVQKDKDKAAEWMLLAVIEAEKEFGSKTGVLKLRYVYDMFLSTFPILSKFISFDDFGMMVDDSLDRMKHLLDTNAAISTYIGGLTIE